MSGAASNGVVKVVNNNQNNCPAYGSEASASLQIDSSFTIPTDTEIKPLNIAVYLCLRIV